MAKTVDLGAVTAYAIAVENGFKGTIEEWLKSLIGPQGPQGGSVTGAAINELGHLIISVYDPVTGQTTQLDAGNVETSTVLEAAKKAIAEAGSAQVKIVQQAGGNEISGVQKSSSDAVTAIQQEQGKAVQAVQEKQTSAVAAVDSAQKAAAQNIIAAGTAEAKKLEESGTQQVARVTSEGDKQAERLSTIFPTPTMKDDNKVPTVEGGKYILKDPAPGVNDASVSDKAPWSSKKTVDALCSPFCKKAPLVQGEFVADYPMTVKSCIEPVQEGTGDPSPENVRPIHGVTEVKAVRCGKNLLDLSNGKSGYTHFGNLKVTLENDKIHIKGTSDSTNANASFVVWRCNDTRYSGRKLQIKAFNFSSNMSDFKNIYGFRNATETDIAVTLDLKTGVQYDFLFNIAAFAPETDANSYEPYHDETYIQNLSDEVYGGVYEWDTGKLTKTVCEFKLKGTENWLTWGADKTTPGVIGFYLYLRDIPEISGVADPESIQRAPAACNWLKPHINDAIIGKTANTCTIGGTDKSNRYIAIAVNNTLLGVNGQTPNGEAIDKLKQYLAGHPLVLLGNCRPFSAETMGKHLLLSLPGVTTVYGSTAQLEVTARLDPNAERKALEKRIAALEKAAVITI